MTKDEERAALKKIMKIVDGLDGDSYVRKACEGLEEIAEDNIGNDFMQSWKERFFSLADHNEEETTALHKELSETREELGKTREELDKTRNKLERTENQYELAEEQQNERRQDYIEECTKNEKLTAELKAAQQTIIELKAKLYDLIATA